MNELSRKLGSFRGLVVLDKEQFKETIEIPILKIDISKLNSVFAFIKKYILKIPNFKPVQEDKNHLDKKIVFLNPILISSYDSFLSVEKEKLKHFGISSDDFCYQDTIFSYDNWKADEIINSIIPSTELFSSYTQIGRIVQVILKPELLPYKNIIGVVLLEKVKSCEIVVNKIDIISNTFRNFKMEVIAGNSEGDLKTVVKENNCLFEFDFSKVYFNTRLGQEHSRIISKLKTGDILYDVFCGVGPFSIPAAKKGVQVLANDANPDCCKWLEFNIRKNRIKKNQIEFRNRDGFEFITEDLKNHFLKNFIAKNLYNEDTKVHVTMNLPSIAYNFLKAFIGLFEGVKIPTNLFPIVHLYCFAKNEKNPLGWAKSLIEETLNMDLKNENSKNLEITNIRNVAPNKDMIRVSFVLNSKILCSDKQEKNFGTNSIKRNLKENDSCKKICI